MIPKIELAGTDEIRAFQEEKLQKALAYASQNSPYYKKFFETRILIFLKSKRLKIYHFCP